MKKDELGTRMKEQYERRSQSSLPRRTYTIIRLDGKAFHTLTKNCERPYDKGLMEDMDNTAKYLCENIQGCKLAYTQSDEISLVLTDFDTITTDAWFDGNVQKITSISASLATAKFNQLRALRCFYQADLTDAFMSIDERRFMNLPLASFDSRCFVIPDPVEVYNCLLWRQQDCTRNSIQMVGQAHFSQKKLQGKNCNEIQEMLWQEKNINWNDSPDGFKRGRCVIKESYNAIMDPQFGEGMVTRTRWVVTNPPVFSQDKEWIWNQIPRLN